MLRLANLRKHTVKILRYTSRFWPIIHSMTFSHILLVVLWYLFGPHISDRSKSTFHQGVLSNKSLWPGHRGRWWRYSVNGNVSPSPIQLKRTIRVSGSPVLLFHGLLAGPFCKQVSWVVRLQWDRCLIGERIRLCPWKFTCVFPRAWEWRSQSDFHVC